MARTRQLKPEFWTDDDVVTLGMGAKLLFIGMWGLADREGRLEDKPLSILARILPNERELDPRLLLGELAARRLIRRYTAEIDGRLVALIQIRSFKRHQHIHPDEAKSKLPPPPEENTNDSSEPRDSLASPEKPGNPSESLPTSDFRLPASDLFATPAHDPSTSSVVPPKKHPTDYYGLLQLFGRLWLDRYNEPWIRDQWDPKAADSFIEAIRGLSPPDRDATFAAIPDAIARYLATDTDFYRSRRHPFQSFTKDFNGLRKGSRREPQMIGKQKIANLPVA